MMIMIYRAIKCIYVFSMKVLELKIKYLDYCG